MKILNHFLQSFTGLNQNLKQIISMTRGHQV